MSEFFRSLHWEHHVGCSPSALATLKGQMKETIDTFKQQVPHLAAGIHAWWHWVFTALAEQTDHVETQNWAIQLLLPWVYWLDWARWMANNYQRTSSAVEGRNGYLSRLHHSGRGFSALD